MADCIASAFPQAADRAGAARQYGSQHRLSSAGRRPSSLFHLKSSHLRFLPPVSPGIGRRMQLTYRSGTSRIATLEIRFVTYEISRNVIDVVLP